MTLHAIDCQGFAGGFTLGVVQAGFTLAGKRELPGAFGVASCEANRHLLGDAWETNVGDWTTWTPYRVPLVFGNPPCSGFSLLSHKDFRGSASPINSCMWALINFAARCDPEMVIFESVQPAFSQGRDLMQALRASLEEQVGRPYDLVHVLHNANAVGGCAERRRYFFVASRIPFGIEIPTVTRVPTLMDAIGDLRGLGNTWNPQPYRYPSSWWSRRLRSNSGVVDGHYTRLSPAITRALELMNGVEWGEGENVSNVARRYFTTHGRLPDSWAGVGEKLIGNDFKMGFYQMHRWKAEGVTRVVTGAAPNMVLHPHENRTMTNREAARIQGFPDDWTIRPLRAVPAVSATWGKGIPVDCGRWIAGWARAAIEGSPGTHVGEEIGERERKIDITNLARGLLPGVTTRRSKQ